MRVVAFVSALVLIIGSAACGSTSPSAPTPPAPQPPSPPAPVGPTGTIAADVAADIITFNQNAIGGSAFRRLGVIARWEGPVPVYVEPPVQREGVAAALEYWKERTGIDYVLLDENREPRIYFRSGTDGLGAAAGRGLIDGTYADNRARSALVVVRPDLTDCGITSCRGLYRHELGHALGFLEHATWPTLMSGGTELSDREIVMMRTLYSLPHGTRVEPSGHWAVVLQ